MSAESNPRPTRRGGNLMRAIKALHILLIPFAMLFSVQAQDETTFTSTVNWFYSACEDRMVIDLSGTMEAGYDLYYQAFDAYGGLGAAITGLRRVSVDGDYAVSQIIYWLDGATRALGTPISVDIRIASENDPESTIFQAPSDDTLGECAEPASTLVEGIDTSDLPRLVTSSGVFTPDGGLLNPVYSRPAEPIVQIGARPAPTTEPGRTANPGLVFAECADVEGADPGLLYDTDTIRVFWSWYAKTQEQVQAHIDNAQYAITLHGLSIPNVEVSEVKQIPGSLNWWVFYTVNFGDKWEPGIYDINYAVGWAEAISDGYANFGPGTENERLGSRCTFIIQQNPYGVDVLHEQPAMPLKTYPWGE